MNFQPSVIESGIWKYLGEIHIAVFRIRLASWSVDMCNDFCRTLFGSLTPEDLKDFMQDFLASPEPGSSMPFHDHRKRMLHGNFILSGYSFTENDSITWVFFQDMTELIRLESIAEAVNVMDNIGYIFSGIRHEIGNPINTIKMTMSVLKKNLPILPVDKIQSYIDRTQEEILRLEELLQSLKSYNMFDKPKPQNVHLPSFMNKFISLIEQDFHLEGVAIKINTTGDLWANVDPRGLQQVLLNVTTNAFDALHQTPDPRITINMFRIINQVFIKIIDNGCGIPEEQQANLFHPFYTTKVKGTGLGLVISQKILKSMGSSIRIESQPGKGSRVILCLPGGQIDD